MFLSNVYKNRLKTTVVYCFQKLVMNGLFLVEVEGVMTAQRNWR